MVSTREGPQVVEEWMYQLFRQQHEEKFLSSFQKLGLDGLPDAVASAQYHVLSNTVGGVGVEYLAESDTKAWVRYRYPRWWLGGPAICGIPVEASRGFMRGWHANNGVSLGNPNLGFVCVSEDMTGEFGFCGHFREFGHELSEAERLQYSKEERPPAFDPAAQPYPPSAEWNEARLAKVVGTRDGNAKDAARFLAAMFEGMGDSVEMDCTAKKATLCDSNLRITRNISGDDRDNLLTCWTELWKGAITSHRAFMHVAVADSGEALDWTISVQ